MLFAPGIIILVPRANIAKHIKVNNILLRKSLFEGLNNPLRFANILNHLSSSTSIFNLTNSLCRESISLNCNFLF